MEDDSLKFEDIPDHIKIRMLTDRFNNAQSKIKALKLENDSFYDEIITLRNLSKIQDLEKYRIEIKQLKEENKSLKDQLTESIKLLKDVKDYDDIKRKLEASELKIKQIENNGFPDVSSKAFTKMFFRNVSKLEIDKQVEIEIQNLLSILQEYETRDSNPLVSYKKIKKINARKSLLEEQFLMNHNLMNEWIQFQLNNPITIEN